MLLHSYHHDQGGMSITSISTEDIDLLDFESPSPDYPVMVSHSSDRSSLSPTLDSAKHGSPVPLNEDLDNRSEPLALQSFLPVLQELKPALVLVDHVYHLRGAILKDNLRQLSMYARRITEFTLTDKQDPNEHPIAPGALFRLSQLHNHTQGPFFPSLNRLRIIVADSSLAQLSLFLTPSLRSLEFSGTEENSFISYLATLADEASSLSSITLGPLSRISRESMTVCLGFRNLRELQLLDVLPTFDSELLEEIGKLPELETFVLDARSVDYFPPPMTATCFPPKKKIIAKREAEQRRQEEEEERAVQQRLRKELEDIRTRSSQLNGSPIPSEPSTRPPSPCPSIQNFTSTELPSNPADVMDDSDPAPSQKLGFYKLTKLHIVGETKLLKDVIDHVASADVNDVSLTVFTRTPDAHYFASLVEELLSKWKETLNSVCIHYQWPDISQHASPGILPNATFERLLLQQSLERLEISGWAIDSDLKGHLRHLTTEAPSKLKIFHLPVQATNGMSLTRLRSIVEACPDLVSFQCGIKHLSNIPSYPVPALATDMLNHGLEELSVGNPSPHDDPQRLLLVAQYLDILFPKLKRIRTHPGNNDKQWNYIYDLVKMCQTSRSHHGSRSDASD
ncbi:hypothetical protein BDZ97DRAFT_1811054 [Flammula alnicola]|nr:hypothetical protein BDZ97DRAFT_1811054 [Flammula alnicola]